jgi:hypothetical protein
VERSSILAGDVYNARQFIGNIHKSYGDIFSINVMMSWLQMCVLISAVSGAMPSGLSLYYYFCASQPKDESIQNSKFKIQNKDEQESEFRIQNTLFPILVPDS